MQSTDLTVAALVEHGGRFLIVEERASGRIVLTQPGGHIETGESPEEAARREVLEEAGCEVTIRDLIGAYHWQDDGGRQFLRIVFVARLDQELLHPELDRSIRAVHWYSYAELAERSDMQRSPSVLRCIDDYLAGERQPRSLFAGCAQPERALDMALASASLLHS